MRRSLLALFALFSLTACEYLDPNPGPEVEKRNPWIPYSEASEAQGGVPAGNSAGTTGDEKCATGGPLADWDCLKLPPGMPPAAASWPGPAKGFALLCAKCHGPYGQGNEQGKQLGVKDLTSNEVQKLSDEELAAVIRDGSKNNKMPAFKDAIAEPLIKDLVNHVRDLPNRKSRMP